MRVSVRVKPGASRTKVGGQYGEQSPTRGGGTTKGAGHHGEEPAGGVLIVAVAQRAVDGAATEAVLKAVAKAFGLRRADVALVNGRTSRTKVLELQGDRQALSPRLAELLHGAEPGRAR